MAKTKHVANAPALITEAFSKMPLHIQPIVNKLRELVHRAEPGIIEDWKWGPNFYCNGMVCNIWGFKNHASITFFNGSSMSDKEGLFNYGEANSSSRTIKFKALSELNSKQVLAYIKESVNINKKGLHKAAKDIEIPELLLKALKKHKLLTAFEGKSFTFRKEIIQGITGAKQDTTKQKRLDKTIETLKAG